METKQDVLNRLVHSVTTTPGTISIHPQLQIPLREFNISVSYDIGAVQDLMMLSDWPTMDIIVEMVESIKTTLIRELNDQ